MGTGSKKRGMERRKMWRKYGGGRRREMKERQERWEGEMQQQHEEMEKDQESVTTDTQLTDLSYFTKDISSQQFLPQPRYHGTPAICPAYKHPSTLLPTTQIFSLCPFQPMGIIEELHFFTSQPTSHMDGDPVLSSDNQPTLTTETLQFSFSQGDSPFTEICRESWESWGNMAFKFEPPTSLNLPLKLCQS